MASSLITKPGDAPGTHAPQAVAPHKDSGPGPNKGPGLGTLLLQGRNPGSSWSRVAEADLAQSTGQSCPRDPHLRLHETRQRAGDTPTLETRCVARSKGAKISSVKV